MEGINVKDTNAPGPAKGLVQVAPDGTIIVYGAQGEPELPGLTLDTTAEWAEVLDGTLDLDDVRRLALNGEVLRLLRQTEDLGPLAQYGVLARTMARHAEETLEGGFDALTAMLEKGMADE